MPNEACGLFLCLLLAGCGDSTTPTSDDDRAFDSTAEMLDSAPGELNDIDENQVADEVDGGAEGEPAGS